MYILYNVIVKTIWYGLLGNKGNRTNIPQYKIQMQYTSAAIQHETARDAKQKTSTTQQSNSPIHNTTGQHNKSIHKYTNQQQNKAIHKYKTKLSNTTHQYTYIQQNKAVQKYTT